LVGKGEPLFIFLLQAVGRRELEGGRREIKHKIKSTLTYLLFLTGSILFLVCSMLF
jgi:hypothetical protein